ncbi:ribonuclease H-like domain-containing protein [Methanolobus sp. ZRKC2]|uniref:ribonuclease H-like domain-containing protein n=1 Tax=Methanolobus sp. ZRKC2 TaxID=3125783 RepID=UPI00324C2438
MLTSTYIHIPRVGATIEKKIWASGVRTWDEFSDKKDVVPIPRSRMEMILPGIEESKERLASHDFEFFARSLPSAEHWRAFSMFSEKAAYVDIETTGLSPGSSHITVIGIYDGKDAKTFIHGIDLDDVVEEFEKYEYLVTFNGARFDLPFIKREFPEVNMNKLHADLMYPLRRISLTGGLKKIEVELGISRKEDVAGITGFDAVRLWHQYRKGDQEALELLLEYNREDTINLKTIMEMTLPRFIEHKFSESI